MIIAMTHAKGGVGKTTIATHLAGWFHLYGYSIALLDCDAQRLSSRWLKRAVPEISVFTSSNAEEIIKLLPEIYQQHEVVIVDGPGGLGEVSGAILACSDAILIPTGASNLDIWALDWATDTVHAIQKLRDGLPQAVIVPAQVGPNYRTTRFLLSEARKLGFGVTTCVLPHRQIYAQAAGLRDKPPQLLWQMGRSRRVRQAALEMDALIQEVFPEACEHDPNAVRRLVSPPIKKTQTGRGFDENRQYANG